MNHEQTEKQVKERLIPNLSKRRVISTSQHTSYSILNIKFMVYLTILSVAQTTECWMKECLVNNDLGRKWKEAAVV
jgi:hypothetical protein